ncbi:MAG: protein kinase domain-containing protein [Acidobacteriota bacterium]
MSSERRALIERLLERAAPLPPDEQAALLDAECAGDPALREEVEKMLRLEAVAERFLERPAIVLAAEAEEWEEAGGAVSPGGRAGPYEVLEALGAGGMGEVYRARDTRLGRDVALKFLPRRFSRDPVALERFRREARAASALNHPNICTVYDIGAHEGQPYFVMELLEGRTLKARLAEGPFTPRELANLATQCAAALEAAHAKGIIHRDVKPANIFLTAGGTVKVLDFGVAKSVGEPVPKEGAVAHAGGETLTRTGAVPGTAAYISPEQIRGGQADARSDLFALGVTLYQAATGELPFQGAGWTELREAILNSEPAPPRRLNPALPRGMERIILKLLEKDPARRYQNAREMAVDLKRLSTVGARSRWVWAAGLAVAAIAGLVWQSQRASETQRVVVLPLHNLTGDAAQEPLLEAIRDGISGDLARLRSLRLISGNSARKYGGAPKSAQEIGRELKVDLVLEGRAWREGNRLRTQFLLTPASTGKTIWSQRFDMEPDSIHRIQGEVAHAVARAIGAGLSLEEEARLTRGGPVNRGAFENYVRGRHYWSKRTDAEIDRAVSYFRAAIDAEPAWAAPYAALADCYNQFATVAIGRPPAEYRPLAIAAARRAIEIDPENAQARAALGFAHMYNWNWAEAKRELDRALELDPSYASAHVWRASWHVIHGQFSDAVADVERARDLDPLSLITQTQVGWIYYFTRRRQEAMSIYQRVLATDPNFLWALWQLAGSLAEAGRTDEAIRLLEHARSVHGDMPALLGALGSAYGLAGRKAEARQLLGKLDALAKIRYVTPQARANVLLSLGDLDGFFDALEEGYRQRTNNMAYLGVDPRFQQNPAVRNHPRYNDLLRRIGIKSFR